jgi:hypothetical protein
MQTQIELAGDLGYLAKEQVGKLMEQGTEVARLINGLLASMSRAEATGKAEANSANAAGTANSARKGIQR